MALATCTHSELGIGIVAYGPLGHGFFGGKAVVESLPSESLMVCDYKYMEIRSKFMSLAGFVSSTTWRKIHRYMYAYVFTI